MVETRRRQIDSVASALFRERGYRATSVRELARALDIQGPSLYAHVSSKEDVLWSIVERAADAFRDEVEPLARGPGDAAQRLAAMIRAHVRVVTAQREHAAVFLREWRFLGPERRAEMARRRERYERLFRAVIAEGVERGVLASSDPRLAAIAMLSSLNGIADWYSPEGPLDETQIGDRYADLFLAALGARADATRSQGRSS